MSIFDVLAVENGPALGRDDGRKPFAQTNPLPQAHPLAAGLEPISTEYGPYALFAHVLSVHACATSASDRTPLTTMTKTRPGEGCISALREDAE